MFGKCWEHIFSDISRQVSFIRSCFENSLSNLPKNSWHVPAFMAYKELFKICGTLLKIFRYFQPQYFIQYGSHFHFDTAITLTCVLFNAVSKDCSMIIDIKSKNFWFNFYCQSRLEHPVYYAKIWKPLITEFFLNSWYSTLVQRLIKYTYFKKRWPNVSGQPPPYIHSSHTLLNFWACVTLNASLINFISFLSFIYFI